MSHTLLFWSFKRGFYRESRQFKITSDQANLFFFLICLIMSFSNNPFNPFRLGNSSSSSGGNDKSGKNTLKPSYSANANNPFRPEYDEESSNNPWAGHSNSPKKSESRWFEGGFSQGQTGGPFRAASKDPWASSTWKPEPNKTTGPFSNISGYEMFNKGRPVEQQYKPSAITSSYVQEKNDQKNSQDSAQHVMPLLQPTKKW